MVKGLNKIENKFEILKKDADEAFKMKNYSSANEIYTKLISQMELMDEQDFIKNNSNKIFEKGI